MGPTGLVASAIAFVTGAFIYWSGSDANSRTRPTGPSGETSFGAIVMIVAVLALIVCIAVCLRSRRQGAETGSRRALVPRELVRSGDLVRTDGSTQRDVMREVDDPDNRRTIELDAT